MTALLAFHLLPILLVWLPLPRGVDRLITLRVLRLIRAKRYNTSFAWAIAPYIVRTIGLIGLIAGTLMGVLP